MTPEDHLKLKELLFPRYVEVSHRRGWRESIATWIKNIFGIDL